MKKSSLRAVHELLMDQLDMSNEFALFTDIGVGGIEMSLEVDLSHEVALFTDGHCSYAAAVSRSLPVNPVPRMEHLNVL